MGWSALLRDISLIIVSWSAIYGVDAWRREYRGKRQIELAEDTLALFYQAQDAINYIRFPLAAADEGKSRSAPGEETEEEKRVRDQAYVMFERYNQHHDIFNKIHSLRYRFMAQFGREAATPFDDLKNHVNKILSSARRLSVLWAKDPEMFVNEEQKKSHYQKIEALEKLFWWQGDDDPITKELDKIINAIESTCQNIITAKGSLYSLLNIRLPFTGKYKRAK